MEAKDANSGSILLKNLALGFSFFRSAQFMAQGALLPLADCLAIGRWRERPASYPEQLLLSLPKIKMAIEKDVRCISQGIYPVQVLQPEGLFTHLNRIPRIFFDAYDAAKRRQTKKNKAFSKTAEEQLEDLPEYYKRNFHFQLDGYLGKTSAELYDHQVEVLFAGTAGAMRRSAILPIKKHFNTSSGKGLHLLEIGCGTGNLTRDLALAFPKARITCVDLSSAYLKYAAEKLENFERVNYVQGAAENLNFKDAVFDGVVSCYLFHELPEQVREQVVKEGKRLLRPGGIYVIADSIQLDDDPELNWALHQFPKDFHEPFYKNYIQNPVKDLLEKNGFQNIRTEITFLTQVTSGI